MKPMKLTLKIILGFLVVVVCAFCAFAFYGCTGVHIKHSMTVDPTTKAPTYTTEYDRSVWVNQNIEGLDVSIDPATGIVHAVLKGQSSESTALNNAITTMGSLTGMAMQVLKAGSAAP